MSASIQVQEPSDVSSPIPMSFPSVLRNPGLADRFAHLHIATTVIESTPVSTGKKKNREDREGKRWARRKENARFANNPHIVVATKTDYFLALPNVKATFPEPLPPYLPRNQSVSSISPPHFQDHNSSNAGRFSLSLKGMRKELRKSGARAQYLVRDVESEIVTWLQEGGVLLSPDNAKDDAFTFPGKPIGDSQSILEVARTPLQLVWAIIDNAFARYIVHCCARFYEVVSFSKDVSGQRLTYLLRPNVTRPDHSAAAALDTPPPTDFDYSSQGDPESESDFTSDRDVLESSGEVQRLQSPLSSISENSPSSHLYHYRAAHAGEPLEDGWSVIGADTEPDADLSGSEPNSTGLLPLQDDKALDIETAIRPDLYSPRSPQLHIVRRSPLSRVWERRSRANSSPSRSPARRPVRRAVARVNPPRSHPTSSFYNYLFADRAG